MKLSKKMLAMVLALCMVFTLIPVSGATSAADETDSYVAWNDADNDGVQDADETTYTDLSDAFGVGGNVTLLKDVEITESFRVAQDTTLDLGGNTLSAAEDLGLTDMFGIDPDVTFTVTNGTIQANHDGDSVFWHNDGGTLILEDVTVTAEELNYACVYVYDSELQLKGETTIDSVDVNSGTVTIDGNDVTVSNWIIYGGTFNVDPTTLPGFDADTYEAVKDDENGTWKVQEKNTDPNPDPDPEPSEPIAWNDADNDGVQDADETTYTDLSDAFEVGGNVTLLKDVEITEYFRAAQDTTLNLGGNTLSTAENLGLTDMFGIDPDVTFTVTNGTIQTNHDGDSVFWHNDGGTLILEDVTVTAEELNYACVYVYNSELQLKGETTIDSVDVNSGTVTIDGNDVTVSDWSISGGTFNVDPTTLPGFDADTYEAVKDEENGTWTVQGKNTDPDPEPSEPIAWNDADNDGVQDADETTYTDLSDAFGVGGNVTLLKDVEITESFRVAQDTTLNLGGNTLSAAEDFANLDMFYIDPDVTFTVANGTIQANHDGDSVFWHSEGGTLILEDVTVTAEELNYACVYVYDSELQLKGETTIDSVDVNSGTVTIDGNDVTVSNWSIYGGTFNVDPTTLRDFDENYCITDNKDGTWTVAYINREITEAQVMLGYDLILRYYARVDEVEIGENQLAMIFTMNGKDTLVEAFPWEDDELYSFDFINITPQCMGDTIDAKLVLLNVAGEVVETLDEYNGYSVKAYCQDVLEGDFDSDIPQLIADLLAYGAAAQTYRNYKTDALVTSGMDLVEASTNVPDKTDMVLSDRGSESTYFTSAGVWFDYVNRMYFKFTTDDVSKVTVKITMGGETVTGKIEEVGNGVYVVYTNPIYAMEFDDVSTIELCVNGTVVQTLQYSVKSYVYAMQSSKNENMKALANALYNYGVSTEKHFNRGQ